MGSIVTIGGGDCGTNISVNRPEKSNKGNSRAVMDCEKNPIWTSKVNRKKDYVRKQKHAGGILSALPRSTNLSSWRHNGKEEKGLKTKQAAEKKSKDMAQEGGRGPIGKGEGGGGRKTRSKDRGCKFGEGTQQTKGGQPGQNGKERAGHRRERIISLTRSRR